MQIAATENFLAPLMLLEKLQPVVVQVVTTLRDSQICHGICSNNYKGCIPELTYKFNKCVSAIVVILRQLVLRIFSLKKSIGLWKRTVLIKQLALLLPALPVCLNLWVLQACILSAQAETWKLTPPIPLHESVHNSSNILTTLFYFSLEGNTDTSLIIS